MKYCFKKSHEDVPSVYKTGDQYVIISNRAILALIYLNWQLSFNCICYMLLVHIEENYIVLCMCRNLIFCSAEIYIAAPLS